MSQWTPFRLQVQAKSIPSDGSCGHAGKHVPERLLPLRRLPAVHEPEVRQQSASEVAFRPNGRLR